MKDLGTFQFDTKQVRESVDEFINEIIKIRELYASNLFNWFRKPKCECGADKTYGENCDKRFHSAWCGAKHYEPGFNIKCKVLKERS